LPPAGKTRGFATLPPGRSRPRSVAAPDGQGDGRRRQPTRFPRAERPAPVPAPEHHHLPGWVKRDFARARPALADLLALLEGDDRARLQDRLHEITTGIGEGKFSLAWQYPELVAEGRELYERQRRRNAETARVARTLETARRRVLVQLRDAGPQLGQEAAARLQRALRAAVDSEAIAAVEAELDRALEQGRTASARRQQKEIERTRARIHRSMPNVGVPEPETVETWQDVLRRFAEQQSAQGEPEPD
jgi:hypothetical protein